MANKYRENREGKQYYVLIGGQFRKMTVIAGRIALIADEPKQPMPKVKLW